MGRPDVLIIRPRNVLKAALLIVGAIMAIAFAWATFAASDSSLLIKSAAVFSLLFFVALPAAGLPLFLERQWSLMLSAQGLKVNPFRGDQLFVPWRDIESFGVTVAEGSAFLEIRLAAPGDPRQRKLCFESLDLDRSVQKTKKLLEEWRLRALQPT